MATQEHPLTPSEQTAFAECAAQALGNLGLTDSTADPKTIVQAVEDFVDRWQAAQRNPLSKLHSRRPDPIDVSLGLGSLWGNQIVRQFGWEWTCIRQNGRGLHAVVAPDRSAAVFPTYFLKACLDDPRVDCTAVLAFNMMDAGKLPALPAQGYMDLMQGVRRVVPKR